MNILYLIFMTDKELIYNIIGTELSNGVKYILDDTFTFDNDQIISMNPLLFDKEIHCAPDIEFLDYLRTKLRENSNIERINEILILYDSKPFVFEDMMPNKYDKYQLIMGLGTRYYYKKLFMGFVLDKFENIPIKTEIMKSYNNTPDDPIPSENFKKIYASTYIWTKTFSESQILDGYNRLKGILEYI